MRLVIQRVQRAAVSVGDKTNRIGAGCFVLVGVNRYDNENDVVALARKLMSLRLFSSPAKDASASASEMKDSSPAASPTMTVPDLKHDPFDGDSETVKPWAWSVMDAGLDVMLVSQFTLCAVLKGNKPDFHCAMGGDGAAKLFAMFVALCNKHYDEFAKPAAKGQPKKGGGGSGDGAAAAAAAAAAASANSGKKRGQIVTGFFGEHMTIDTACDGPVTITLESTLGEEAFEKTKTAAALMAAPAASSTEEQKKDQ